MPSKKPPKNKVLKKIPYAIGSDKYPGLSKLIEEAGETSDVLADFLLLKLLGRLGMRAGKILGFGSMGRHWDGNFLRKNLEEEIADIEAAIEFVKTKNKLNKKKITKRRKEKLKRFNFWHQNVQAGRDPKTPKKKAG